MNFVPLCFAKINLIFLPNWLLDKNIFFKCALFDGCFLSELGLGGRKEKGERYLQIRKSKLPPPPRPREHLKPPPSQATKPSSV